MRNNIQKFIQPFNILLLFLILAISNTCTQDNDEIPDEEQVKSDVLFDSIDELMKTPDGNLIIWHMIALVHNCFFRIQ